MPLVDAINYSAFTLGSSYMR